MKYERKIRLIVSLVLVAFIIGAFYDFTVMSFENAKISSYAHLREISAQTASTIRIKMESSLEYVKSAAVAFSQFDDLQSADAIAVLEQVAEASPFERMWVTGLDLVATSNEGKHFISENQDFFVKAIAGESGITDVLVSEHNGENVFLVYTPIMHGGKPVAMLHGVYEVAQMSDSILLEAFHGQGYSYIFGSDGTVVCSPNHVDSLNVTGNFFDFFEKAKFTHQTSYNKLLDAVWRGDGGNITFIVDGKERHAAYVPVGVKDWYVLTVIPKSVVVNHNTPITDSAFALTMKLITALLLFTFVRVYLERQSKKQIENAYAELAFLNDNIPGGVQKCSTKYPYEMFYYTDGFVKHLGYNREEIRTDLQNLFINTVHPDDRERIADELSKISFYDDVITLRYRLNAKGGLMVWVSDQRRRIIDEDNSYYYCIIFDITETKKAEDALKVSIGQYEIAISQSEQIIFEYDTRTHKAVYSDRRMLEERLGVYMETLPEELIVSNVLDPDCIDSVTAMYESICSGEKAASCEMKILKKDGMYTWQKILLTNIFDDQGIQVKAIGVMQDISKEKEAQIRLKQEENYRKAILGETLYVYEFCLSKQSLYNLRCSKAYSGTQYEFSPYLIDENNLEIIHPDDREEMLRQFDVSNLWKIYHSEFPEMKLQYRMWEKRGRWIWAECTVHFLKSESTHEIQGIAYVKDIDLQKKKELILQNKAERDALTGLYDRAVMKERIKLRLEESDDTALHAFLVLDIDYFKAVNDTYGHLTGDHLLKAIAEILKTRFRKGDVLGRLGGDEFVVFVSRIDSMDAIAAKAGELCRAVRAIYLDQMASASTSVSIGIALSPQDGTTFEELYQKADAALYCAKKRGRNQFAVYEDSGSLK